MNIEILEEGKNTKNPKVEQGVFGPAPFICRMVCRNNTSCLYKWQNEE